MTRLMEQAIERLKSLPESQQDPVANFLLNELDEDQRWADSSARHSDGLDRLVDRLLADDAARHLKAIS